MFNTKILKGEKNFYQSREEYLEELECSQTLEGFLYDEVYECVESSSALIEAALANIAAA